MQHILKFIFIAFIFFSCNTYKIAGNESCFNKRIITLIAKEYKLSKTDFKKIVITKYSEADTLCMGLYLVHYEFKGRTGIVIPVLMAKDNIFIYDQDERQKNLSNLNKFKLLADKFISIDGLAKIEKRYLDGILSSMVL
jgi:hypothetical protein